MWFYDMSAGPDGLNWNVDDFEFFEQFGTGSNRFIDFRVPPIWEMRESAPEWMIPYAAVAAGLLGRYALYGVLHASPLYDPLVSLPKPGGKRIARLNVFRENPSIPLLEFWHTAQTINYIRKLQPYIPIEHTVTERPLDDYELRTYEIFARGLAGEPVPDDCWSDFGYAAAQLYCHVAYNTEDYAQGGGPNDWVAPVMFYEVSDETVNTLGKYNPLGISDSDPNSDPYATWGTMFPRVQAVAGGVAPGEGGTHLMAHELGHHVGLAHEHDFWDSEDAFEYSSYLNHIMWVNDGCACTMGYLNDAWFGRFERDSVARSLTGRMYTTARAMLPGLPKKVRGDVTDRLRQAYDALHRESYIRAVTRAKSGYYLAWRNASPRIRRSATSHPAWRSNPKLDMYTIDPDEHADLGFQKGDVGPLYGSFHDGGPLLDSFLAAR